MHKSRKQVTQGLPWSRFSNGHNISTLKSNRPWLSLNWSRGRKSSVLYLEKAKFQHHISIGQASTFLIFLYWAYGRVEWQKKQPPYQVAKACISKLEQEEASSFIQTEWQTESSPTAVLATNLGDLESPSQKWVHRKRALQIKCKPPQEGSTAYDIGSSQEQISHLRQKVQMAKN